MRDLAKLQECFADALLSGVRADACAALLEGEAEHASARLAVYRGNSVANARGALANAYPIVEKIVGSEFFDGLAREYWRTHPAVSGDLNEYGERLPEFIAAFRHTEDLPYLPDVARMEWLAHRAYYAKDPPAFDTRALAAAFTADADKLWAVVAPACALLESLWPLARLWEVHQDDYAGAFSVDWQRGGDHILVYRPEFRPLVMPLSACAFRFLDSIMRERSIGAALADALEAEPSFDLADALPRYVEQRVIVGLESLP